MTQKEAIREVIKECPNITVDRCIELIRERHHITIQPPLFYSVRSDMGYGSRRNGKVNLSADSISRVKEFVDSIKQEGFASTLLTILDELGYATFKESLKVIAHLQK